MTYTPKGNTKQSEARKNPDLICGAKTANGPCRHWKGYLTPHQGHGRCYLHGGLTPQISTGEPNTWGKVRIREGKGLDSIRDLVNDYVYDPDILKLDQEIAIARARIADIDTAGDANIPLLNQLLNTIGKLVKTKHEIEYGRQYVVTVHEVNRLVQTIITAVKVEVQDPDVRERLADTIDRVLDYKPTLMDFDKDKVVEVKGR